MPLLAPTVLRNESRRPTGQAVGRRRHSQSDRAGDRAEPRRCRRTHPSRPQGWRSALHVSTLSAESQAESSPGQAARRGSRKQQAAASAARSARSAAIGRPRPAGLPLAHRRSRGRAPSVLRFAPGSGASVLRAPLRGCSERELAVAIQARARLVFVPEHCRHRGFVLSGPWLRERIAIGFNKLARRKRWPRVPGFHAPRSAGAAFAGPTRSPTARDNWPAAEPASASCLQPSRSGATGVRRATSQSPAAPDRRSPVSNVPRPVAWSLAYGEIR